MSRYLWYNAKGVFTSRSISFFGFVYFLLNFLVHECFEFRVLCTVW